MEDVVTVMSEHIYQGGREKTVSILGGFLLFSVAFPHLSY